MGRLICLLGLLAFQACNAINTEEYDRWFGSHPRAAVACDWTLPDAGILKKNYVVVCPAECLGHAHTVTVFGVSRYSVHSPVCLAALHAGVLNDSTGGEVELNVLEGVTRLDGSLQNGVISRPSDSDFLTFVFGKKEPTPTPKPDACSCCKEATVDVVFVVDSSVSVGEKDFKLAMEFLKDLTNLFEISKTKTRVGLVVFNTNPTTWFKLPRWTTKEAVMKALDSIPYHNGGTYIGKALYKVDKDMIFRSGDDVQKVVIVLSDGKSFDTVKRPVDRLIAKKVKMISLGIGRSRQLGAKTLELIADDVKENVFSIETYTVLKTYVGSLASRLASIIKCPK